MSAGSSVGVVVVNALKRWKRGCGGVNLLNAQGAVCVV